MQGRSGFPIGFAGWFRGFVLFLRFVIFTCLRCGTSKLAEANFERCFFMRTRCGSHSFFRVDALAFLSGKPVFDKLNTHFDHIAAVPAEATKLLQDAVVGTVAETFFGIFRKMCLTFCESMV